MPGQSSCNDCVAGKWSSIVGATDYINTCKECRHLKTQRCPSEDSWDRDEDWMCGLRENKLIESYVSWHEESRVSVPDWCPLRISWGK